MEGVEDEILTGMGSSPGRISSTPELDWLSPYPVPFPLRTALAFAVPSTSLDSTNQPDRDSTTAPFTFRHALSPSRGSTTPSAGPG